MLNDCQNEFENKTDWKIKIENWNQYWVSLTEMLIIFGWSRDQFEPIREP